MSFLVQLRTKNSLNARQAAQGVFGKAIAKFEKAILMSETHLKNNSVEVHKYQEEIDKREESNRVIQAEIGIMQESVKKIRHIIGE